ncbi:Protein transport protein Sec31B [Saguinus oedipus]|uniref:Protein transport protein Sec31B n=1 Tax=Saguinus oedipus TaxID=9490 RepID=A0ABQ9UPQ9_SAGOE|nr:Protein transport protein Sec31B [Saguinus oedipus]
MKLKELERPAVQVWSPASKYPLYLATGTSAQQLDSSFSTNGALEIFEVDFRDPSLDLKRKGVLSASSRFHKLIWGSFGNELLEGSGVIAGGGDNGMLILYSVSHILSSGKEPVIAQKQKHTGAVRALDFNPFQGNLLASGASNSEIFIWDLSHLSVPVTLGSKSQYHEQPPEDIKALSWNRQAQHILSSAHPSGKVVVWDLRKNEPIIKVSDHSNRMHCSGLAWHPDIATQLVLCSEDDRLPVIQLWDLRFASSPLKVLESHSRGILSVSWSQADAELLLSSAKDSQILCWNLGSSEVVYKLPPQSSWCFDVQWCPRDPSVFSAASVDGWISLYSVMGRSWEVQHMRQADKIHFAPHSIVDFECGSLSKSLLAPTLTTTHFPVPQNQRPASPTTAGARASGTKITDTSPEKTPQFGGKLVTFGLPSTPAHLMSQPCSRLVFISQVTTESEFLIRSTELQKALESGNLLTYCQNKSQQALLQSEKMLWQFLKVTLEQDSRMKFLKLLGYSKDELQKKVATWLKSDVGLGESPQPKGNDLSSDRQQVFCSQASKHTTEEASASSAFFDELVPQNMTPWEIPISKDVDGILSQALLLGELGLAVELCLKEERFADAIILAQAGGADLLKQTQEHYLAKKKTKISSLLACVVQKNWKDVVCTCSLKNWREALALLLTYSGPEKFPELCDMLGTRMEQEGGRTLISEARLCYVCSGSVERLVECWAKCHQALSPMALQDLMEKVMVLNRSLELLRGPLGVSPGPATTYRVTQYANLLAAQGSLATAMSFLPSDCAQPPVQQLRDRLFHAQGSAVLGKQSPPFPFPRIVVGATRHSKETSSYSLGSQPSHQKLTRGAGEQNPGRSGYSYQAEALMAHLLPETFLPPAPITAPVMSLTPELRGILPSQPPVSGVSHAPPRAPGERSLQQLQQLPPEKVERKELPPEHQSLKTSFEALLQRCSLSANDLLVPRPQLWTSSLCDSLLTTSGHALYLYLFDVLVEQKERFQVWSEVQLLGSRTSSIDTKDSRSSGSRVKPGKTKRKLKEAAQRLECLYEKLCKGTAARVGPGLGSLTEGSLPPQLSPHVVAGLHEVAHCVDTGSFEQGLAVHAQVAGCSSFSEVSSFMPILKAVLTIAHKLQV